jgi:hypothetical protein
MIFLGLVVMAVPCSLGAILRQFFLANIVMSNAHTLITVGRIHLTITTQMPHRRLGVPEMT